MFDPEEIAAEFSQPDPWDEIEALLHKRVTEDRARAMRNYKPKPLAPKPKTCRCGQELSQKRMGRPRQHCSRDCREESWRAKRS